MAVPESRSFEVDVPADGKLRFSIAAQGPVKKLNFRLSVDSEVVFQKNVSKTNHWWDQKPVDLAEWAGERVELTFETTGEGDHALWGHPVLTSAPEEPQGPNVIVVSIDCLRADHVGLYGYDKPTTPAIDALAGDAVVYDHAVSASSWTIPSHMSMFTGLPPMFHGVNDSPDNFWAGRAKTLAPSVPYLAERLAEAGYETAAVVSSAPMSPRYGFERGFDVYRVHAAKAADVVDSALDLVARADGRRFFLFVHFIDPHWPYMPMVEFQSYTEEFIERFGRRPHDISELIRRHQGKALEALQTDADDVRTLYDAAIAYVDRELGRFFDELKRREIYDDAFVLLTADHGEAFFDHETYGHAKTLYQELTHVPLVVKWPQNAPTGRIDTPVSHVDIFPTVLAVAGVPPMPTEGADLRSPPEGRALVLDASWEDRFRRETMLAVRQGPYKYIAYLPFEPFDNLSLQALLREEFYDLSGDPNESENLIENPPVPLAPFRQRLKAYMDVARVYRSQHEGQPISIDDDLRRSLEALGYVSP